ncbi:MAG: site-2 protease family protein [Candidatus Margulisbacteria bacterium]|nr:site-2 protease family protein [Candidatus Margulisiibacteriota bacterium]
MIIGLIVLLFSIIAHELAHGYTAYYLGDSTAKAQGRLSWNPIVHIDPVGSVLLPLMLFMMGSPVLFGWAKPVPVNPYNLPHPRKSMAYVGAAGPLANFILAGTASIVLHLVPLIKETLIGEILILIVIYNIILPAFNLIPIPPLDGSRVVAGILPYQQAREYEKLEPYGIAIVFLLLYLGVFKWVINLVMPLIYFLIGGHFF